jgi:RimJ/RimL family protein N-acetyltransferase
MPHAVVLRQPLTLDECQIVRLWRNDPMVTPMLRTGAKTEQEQAEFYRNVICNIASGHEYYAVEVDGRFAGIGGLTYLHRAVGETEISLVMGPDYRGRGIGSQVVNALLEEARALGLTAVVGECYAAGATAFWARQLQKHPAHINWRWEL